MPSRARARRVASAAGMPEQDAGRLCPRHLRRGGGHDNGDLLGRARQPDPRERARMIQIRPQTIHSPSGDELVVLTRAEYDALSSAAAATLEEADDIAIFDARVADLTAGRDAEAPARGDDRDAARRLLLRALRRWKGMSSSTSRSAPSSSKATSAISRAAEREERRRPFAPSQERSTSIPPGSALELSASAPASRRRPAAVTACGSRAVAKSARPRRSLLTPIYEDLDRSSFGRA